MSFPGHVSRKRHFHNGFQGNWQGKIEGPILKRGASRRIQQLPSIDAEIARRIKQNGKTLVQVADRWVGFAIKCESGKLEIILIEDSDANSLKEKMRGACERLFPELFLGSGARGFSSSSAKSHIALQLPAHQIQNVTL
ncbi:MAG TPA: hypothetical protein VLE89_00350 [Chlamydiales bacterium]|nr:hypothetical protein [Chlamydiales bacterium]